MAMVGEFILATEEHAPFHWKVFSESMKNNSFKFSWKWYEDTFIVTSKYKLYWA